MSSLKDILRRKEILLLDGAMGTSLMAAGVGMPLEYVNITNPELVASVHRRYVEAGAQMVLTNTIGVNRFRMKNSNYTIEEVSRAGVACGRQAKPRFIGFSMGPTGVLFDKSTTYTYKDAFEAYVEVAGSVAGEVDAFCIETMYDLGETLEAVRAVRATCSLPIFVTFTFGANDTIMSGEGPQEIAEMLSFEGISALGANCSNGPKQITRVIKEMRKVTELPLIGKPNAGLPCKVDGVTIYEISPGQFADEMMNTLDGGATLVGGCCGTDYECIAEIAHRLT